jgi:hypothetical protein
MLLRRGLLLAAAIRARAQVATTAGACLADHGPILLEPGLAKLATASSDCLHKRRAGQGGPRSCHYPHRRGGSLACTHGMGAKRSVVLLTLPASPARATRQQERPSFLTSKRSKEAEMTTTLIPRTSRRSRSSTTARATGSRSRSAGAGPTAASSSQSPISAQRSASSSRLSRSRRAMPSTTRSPTPRSAGSFPQSLRARGPSSRPWTTSSGKRSPCFSRRPRLLSEPAEHPLRLRKTHGGSATRTVLRTRSDAPRLEHKLRSRASA